MALLDVNVLIAMFDPDHIHHDVAHDWFAERRAAGWATCALTENGFVRVLSQIRAEPSEPPSALVRRLHRFCDSPAHEFWTCDVSLRDERLFARSFIVAPRHVTDIYLLGLATSRNGTLATFDRSIPVGAVRGASAANISVIAPV